MSWLLYSQGKSPRYPLDRRLGGPQSLSGGGGEEKNSQPLTGLEPPVIQGEFLIRMFYFAFINYSKLDDDLFSAGLFNLAGDVIVFVGTVLT
jgi:hypothetical protein